jgi:hypothetical protein
VIAEDDDVQLVESIGGIDGMPLTLDVQNMHMHGWVLVILLLFQIMLLLLLLLIMLILLKFYQG